MAAYLREQHDHKLVMGEIENKLVTTNEYGLNKEMMEISNLIQPNGKSGRQIKTSRKF